MIKNLNAYCQEHGANTINVKTFLTLLTLSLSGVDHYDMARKADIAENLSEAFRFIGSCNYALTKDLKDEFFSKSESQLKNVLQDGSGILRFTYECLLIKKIHSFLFLDLNSDCHEIDWTNIYSKDNGFKLEKTVKEFSDSIKRDMAVALNFYINDDRITGFTFKLNRAIGYIRGFMFETIEDTAILGSFIQFSAEVKLPKLLKVLTNHNRAITDVMMVAITAVDSVDLPIKSDDD